jgi:hypothetical protein
VGHTWATAAAAVAIVIRKTHFTAEVVAVLAVMRAKAETLPQQLLLAIRRLLVVEVVAAEQLAESIF